MSVNNFLPQEFQNRIEKCILIANKLAKAILTQKKKKEGAGSNPSAVYI